MLRPTGKNAKPRRGKTARTDVQGKPQRLEFTLTMSQAKQWSIQTTSSQRGDDDAGGTAVPQNVRLRPGAAAQDFATKGQEIKKIVFQDQEKAKFQFFQSGLPAKMEDEKVSAAMMETAMPYIKNGTGSFAFVFNQNLTVENSCFEKNLHFEKKRVCGEGISGKVEAFHDRRSQLSFVRKRFRDGRHLRKEEVQYLLRLNHPGVVRVYALLCADTTVDVLLQDAGHPLRDCLKIFRDKKISAMWYWQVVEELARQGFEVLNYIHQQGICHLDVKPENLLVHQANNKHPVLVLADFGSAVTTTGTVTFNLGLTPEYWAPELWHHLVDHMDKLRTSGGGEQGCHEFAPQPGFDTFAMGLCVYYMATLKHLIIELEKQQMTDDPLIKHQDIQQACQRLGIPKPDFVFKQLLMKQHSHQLPHWAMTSDSWIFPGISDTLLTVMGSTLFPDPDLRWTDQQAVDFLTGKAEHRQGREDEPQLKTPTPVEDGSPYCAGHGHPVQAQPGILPAYEPEEQAYILAAPTDECVRHVEESEEMASVGVQRFQQKISPHMKYWDLSQATAGPPQGMAQVKQPVSTNIGMPTSRMEDPVICVDPQACLPQASTSRADDRERGKKMLSLRSPWTTDTDLCADTDVSKDAEARKKVGDDLNTEVYKKEVVEEGKRSWAEECDAESKGFLAKDLEGKITDCTVVNVAVNMGMLTMRSDAQSSLTTPVKPPALGGKGKAVGKGRGPRKSVKLGCKGEKGREEVGKVMSSCAITKAKTPEKKILHGKKLPLVSSQLKQPVPEIPFVVASSNRPKLSHRRMLGVPMTGADPRPCTLSGIASVTVVEENNLVLVPPPNTFSAVGGELGQGRKPRVIPDQLSDPWDLHGYGNGSLAPAGVASQPQQLVKAVNAESSQAASACSDVTCLNAAVGPPLFVSNGELEPQVMDQAQVEEAGVEELLQLLEADPDHFQVLLDDNQRAQMQEQIAPEGWQAGFTSPVNDMFMSDLNEDIHMDDIADGGFLVDEFATSMNQYVQGNLPDFDQLF